MIKLKIFIPFQTKCLCSKFITLFNSLHERLQYLAVMQLTLPIATGPKISNTYVRMRDPSLQVRPRVSSVSRSGDAGL